LIFESRSWYGNPSEAGQPAEKKSISLYIQLF